MNLKNILLSLLLIFSLNAFASHDKSVVRISTTLTQYDYEKPWLPPVRKNVTGSGVIIENQYILTAAHVVANAKTIEIKKSYSRKRYFAKVKYISHQADLALLELFDTKFFNNTLPIKISNHVRTSQKVIVSGYSLGSQKLNTKKGSISKIKYHPYGWSDEDLLALELDVAINYGYSGGAVVNHKNELVGIAMQIVTASKKTAYAIAPMIIKTFLEDSKDGRVDGFHSNVNTYQQLKNPAIQNFYHINEAGVLVTGIDIEEKQLKVDDVIIQINGHKASSLIKVEFLSQFHTKPLGKRLPMVVLREGKRIKIDYVLSRSKRLLHQEYTQKPRFYIFGGLVFTPITRNYLQAIGMKQYEMNMLFYQQKRDVGLLEPVAWIQTKFSHPISSGYLSKVEMVDMVNGMKVKSLRHMVSLIESSLDEYVVIDFVKKQRVILNKKEALKSFEEIKKQYKLKTDRRL